MRATSRRTATALAVALVAAFVAAGFALAMTRSGDRGAQPAGVGRAAAAPAVAAPRRTTDQQAVLATGAAGRATAPSVPVGSPVFATPPAPAPVPAVSRGPPNLAVTVIN